MKIRQDSYFACVQGGELVHNCFEIKASTQKIHHANFFEKDPNALLISSLAAPAALAASGPFVAIAGAFYKVGEETNGQHRR